tara:strand:- start:297 stop:839 length:543 start_codon:yes stop_codon:yes gene_type:complete
MKYKFILPLVVLIIVALIIGSFYKPTSNSSMLDDADINALNELEHLEKFVLLNEPCQHNIESFQITPDKEIIKNNWSKVKSNLNQAKEAYIAANDIAMQQPGRMVNDKKEVDAAVNNILTGDSKTNAIGAFSDLKIQQKTGDRILDEITTDLKALYKEAGFASGKPDIGFITSGVASAEI